MKYIKVLILFTLFCACATKKEIIRGTKENEINKQDTISNYYLFDFINALTSDIYISKLDSIKKGLSTDFFTLRMAYAKTENYSPYSSQINDSLKKARTLIDSLNYQSALELLSRIQKTNYVNIPLHLYCGYIYKEIGDSIKSDFHYNIYNGLLNSIYESGDGISPKTAFIVISTKEEYHFLNWFNFRLREQSLIHADDFSFDMMKVTDPETTQEHEIYFNIELAFSLMSKAFGG